MNELTKDAEMLICCIYKIYLQKRKEGESKLTSRQFEFDFYTSDKKLSSWLEDDVKYTLAELSRKNYIHMYLGCSFSITDETIIYMESRFKNGLIEVTDFLAKFL